MSQKKIAIAVSGGPDSMALAHALITLQECCDKEIDVLSVDHRLRDESMQEVQMVSKWIQDMDINHVRHHVLKWEGEKPKEAILEQARDARYELINTHCHKQNINFVFLGHHQDDQAETFLIRLIKGSGLDGLSSMAPISSYRQNEGLYLCRPFLEVPKDDLVKYCEEYNIPFVRDPSNEDRSYLRSRLRQVSNELEREGLSSKRLAKTASRMARARQALEEMGQTAYGNCVIEKNDTKVAFDWERLHIYPAEIGLRVLQIAISHFGKKGAYPVRMERLEDLFDSLWYNVGDFKPRTLGGVKIYFQEKQTRLCVEVEHMKN